jgi:hypothetical protein
MLLFLHLLLCSMLSIFKDQRPVQVEKSYLELRDQHEEDQL